jgi:signal peptidase I
MRKLLPLFVIAILGAGGCGGATTSGRFLASGGSHLFPGPNRYQQGGVSMEPTVKAGQTITVRPVGSDYRPRRGDIVVFHVTAQMSADPKAVFLKRVVALGGETIGCCDPHGKVTVNGKPLAEPYVVNDSPLDEPPSKHSCLPRRFGPVTVPAGSLFVMGDNRLYSQDSRCTGTIPVTSVIGVMVS